MDKLTKIFDLKNLEPEDKVVGICDPYPPGYSGVQGKPPGRGEFVGYSSNGSTLSIFRDRLGGRGLYWARSGSKVCISTDMWDVVVFLTPNVKPQYTIDLDYLSEYLAFQVPFTDRTFIQGVRRVRPATIVHFSLDEAKPRFEKYWDVRQYIGHDQFFDPDILYDLIEEAVNWRKNIVGGKYTSYLSGGIDSTTVTMLANPRICFSGYYENEQYSEVEYITEVLRVRQDYLMGHNIKISEDVFYEVLKSLPFILPDPMCGLGVIPQTIIASIARQQGFDYAFTGEGGDEIFMGYNWNYAVIQQAYHLQKLMVRDRFQVGYEPMIQKMLKYGFPGFVALCLGRGNNKVQQVSMIEREWDYSLDVADNVFLININIGLPAILAVDERVGAYMQIEPVSPLIDHKIVEYVASIASVQRSIIPKYLLREAMEDVIPEKIRSRYDKMGFPIPVNDWKWPILTDILSSLEKRQILPEPVKPSDVMTRQAWAYTNIELIMRRLEGFWMEG